MARAEYRAAKSLPFFDSISCRWVVQLLEHPIADRRFVRLLGKWLKKGVLEDGHAAGAAISH